MYVRALSLSHLLPRLCGRKKGDEEEKKLIHNAAHDVGNTL